MEKTTKNPRGAGRKAGITFVTESERKKTRSIPLNDRQYAKFKAIGGSKFLQEILDITDFTGDELMKIIKKYFHQA
jgi:hypothetical protein